MEQFGEQFLHKKDPKLHTTEKVEHEQARKKRLGEKTSQKPAEKLADWLEVIERTHTSHRDDPRVGERIKKHYHDELVIDEEDIPESYYENQARLAREEGHGDIEISEEQRQQLAEVIRADQASTLDKWLDYLTSEDSDHIPMWAKYWAFTSMTKLSTYDKEKKQFGKRDKGTVAPFPDLNREALAYVVDALIKKTGKQDIDIQDPEFEKLLQGANFGKLYAHAIEKVTPTEQNELETTEGEWIKYDKNTDHMPLVESLQGHGTGWCTAGESTAETQLQGGDFYVYYSHDKDGNPTIPRVAIRMQENNIAEVRGIASEQNLDPFIGEVVEDKFSEFGSEGEAYQKKSSDMKRLTEIDNKTKKGQELDKEDLRFLYEIDSKIEGFGYDRDPRIEEIINERNIKKDISFVTGYAEDEISTTQEEALSRDIKYHFGNLNLRNLQSAEGLELPQSVGGGIDLRSLQSAEGLELPQSIGVHLNLYSLQSAEGLELPQSIGGGLNLRRLQSAEGLELPQSIGGDLDLYSLQSAEGLELPQSIGGGLDFYNLQSAEGLELPQSIGGDLSLSNLQSAEGLELPQSIGGNLDLGGLQSAEGLELPQSIGGGLYFYRLQSAEGLELPESIGGDLYLGRLQSAEGLELPQSIGGDLYLGGLQSAEGLELPQSIGGYLDLGRLQSAEKEELRKKYPNLRIN